MTDNTPNLLSDQQMADYRQKGHLTTNRIFDSQTIDTAIRESEDWQQAFLADIDQAEETYFLEQEVAEPTLRKLDQPVYERAHFRRMASHPVLVGCVEQLIGIGVSVYFSQIFCKAPNGSAAKPVHQDNFYFDPDNKDGLITAWVALDDATMGNGCLFFAEGTHLGSVYSTQLQRTNHSIYRCHSTSLNNTQCRRHRWIVAASLFTTVVSSTSRRPTRTQTVATLWFFTTFTTYRENGKGTK